MRTPHHPTADLHDRVDQLRSDLRQMTDRAHAAEKERDQLRQQVRTLTYGGPVNTTLRDWRDHLELIDRIDIEALAVAIGEARNGHPGAQSFDAIARSGMSTVLWCEHHQQDRDDCDVDWLCTGIPVPVTSDPAGTVATLNAMNGDKAAADLVKFGKARGHIRSAARILARLHDRYLPRPADAYTRINTTVNDASCRSCARLTITLQDGTSVKRWERIHRDDLCRWCYDWRRKTATGPPPTEVLAAYHAGRKVTVPIAQAG
jgi:hypothetical protein